MTWQLAQNLRVRSDEVHQVYPDLTIYSIGDQAHQAECSDHNPDSVGTVHAIDIMCAAGTPEALRILPWVLGWHSDLQYVIHNGRIWGVNNGGFTGAGQVYTGSDPHTNHIHVSGRHGSYHRDAATCTGYDLAAEAMTPPPLEEDMTPAEFLAILEDPDVAKLMRALPWQYDGRGIPSGMTTLGVLNGTYTHEIASNVDTAAIVAGVVAALPTDGSSLTVEQITAAAAAGTEQGVAAALAKAAAGAATPDAPAAT